MVGIHFFCKVQPEEKQSAFIDHREQVIALDLRVDAFPATPQTIIFSGAPVIPARVIAGSGKDMVALGLMIMQGGNHFHARQGEQFAGIGEQCLFCPVLIDFTLQQLGFHFAKKLGFIVSQFGLYPILRGNKHLAIGFPYPVILAPRPLVHINGIESARLLEFQQDALNQLLECGRGLLDPRGLETGTHLGIDKHVLVERMAVFETGLLALLTRLRENDLEQPALALFPQGIIELLQHVQVFAFRH